jgi:transcriptional regulator with XRE-family HTH domain
MPSGSEAGLTQRTAHGVVIMPSSRPLVEFSGYVVPLLPLLRVGIGFGRTCRKRPVLPDRHGTSTVGTCRWPAPLAFAYLAATPWGTTPPVRRCGLSLRGATVVTGTSPTVRQRELGKRLRDLRSQHDLTVEDVAQKLLCSATKVSRLETGARRPSLRDVRDLCLLYGVDETTSTELMSLARGAREQGWWTQYEDLDLDPYIGLEQEATAITCYSMYYVTALLQTEDYARTIIKSIAPKIDQAILEQRVEVRVRRQQLLESGNRPTYRALLDEAVLHRNVGGAALMAAQLDKVLQAVRLHQATIQVIPFSVGAYAAADSNFVLLEFGEPELPSVTFVEGLTGNQYHERKNDISRYRETIDYLRDSALSPRESVQLITEMQETYAAG